MKLTLPKWLLEFTGNTHLHKFPCFVSYKPHHHKITGKEVRMILDTIAPGDILLRRFDGYLNTIFTPGFWCHAAIVVGMNSIIHAVSQGVVEEDILEFSRCDSLAILRVKDATLGRITKAVGIAHQFKDQRWEYDYRFARGNGKLYCTEVVDSCYGGLFYDEFSNQMGNFLLVPDKIFTSEHVNHELVIKH